MPHTLHTSSSGFASHLLNGGNHILPRDDLAKHDMLAVFDNCWNGTKGEQQSFTRVVIAIVCISYLAKPFRQYKGKMWRTTANDMRCQSNPRCDHYNYLNVHWLPLVFGPVMNKTSARTLPMHNVIGSYHLPALAMLKIPGPVCLSLKFSSTKTNV